MKKDYKELELKKKRFIPIVDDVRSFIFAWRCYESDIFIEGEDPLTFKQKLKVIWIKYLLERKCRKL